jgi:hypothetical protein
MIKQEMKDKLVEAARRLGKTVEEHAADQLVDMKTSARDSIIRGAVFGAVIGFALCLTFVK